MRFLAVGLCLLVAACGAVMVKQDGPPMANPGEALIVVMRSSFSAGGSSTPTFRSYTGIELSASLYDTTGADIKFIGLIGNNEKLAYSVQPGKYVLMLLAGRHTDFIEANVAAGKTYYVRVSAEADRFGVARYSFQTVRPAQFGSHDFAGWDIGTTLVTKSQKADAWAARNADSIARRRRLGWDAWSSQSPAQRASQTLQAADGR